MWIPLIISAGLLVYLLQNKHGAEIKVGKYFTLDELTNTSSGEMNVPSPSDVANLQHLVSTVLDPLRQRVGPLIVTSGFRSTATNDAVGGSQNSQHLSGAAVDIVPTAASESEVLAVLHTLPVDQVITYEDTNHIHISATHTNRGEFLHYSPSGYEVYSA